MGPLPAPNGETRYSVLNGNKRLEPFEQWAGKKILKSLAMQLEQTGGKAVSRLISANGEAMLISAAWISTGGDLSVKPMAGPPSMMIFADKLTDKKLTEAGLEYGIENVHVSKTPFKAFPENSLTLPATGGSVTFVWRSAEPGAALLSTLLPLIVLLMLGTFFTAFLLMRNAFRKARISDENAFLLEQSRLALSASEIRFRDMAETTTDWLWEADEHQRLIWISDRFPALTGYQITDWTGKRVSDFLLKDEKVSLQLAELLMTGGNLRLRECRYLSAQQRTRYCNLTVRRVTFSGGKLGYRGTATDVTLEVEANARVHYLSHYDELTGLPNRVQMKEFLNGKLDALPDPECALTMIMLDLDKFKPVNDLYGHATGDKVLHEVSGRLRHCIDEMGLVARLGGDEFTILLPDIQNRKSVEDLCRRIVNEISRPFLVNGTEIFIGASLGIAFAPHDTSNASDLLRFADIALYSAKSAGRNNWVFYQRDMGEKIVQRREMEHELREAIQNDQLCLVYQPRYDVKLARVSAVEALVRWRHPRHGTLMPNQFIPMAEETGLIYALSDWVLLKACRDTLRCLPHMSVSVNISASELQDKGFFKRILSVLEQTGLEGHRLEIEVTENAALHNPEQTQQVMQQIKALGVRILIDDFGTGYASLSYLRSFPFDGIKLDKSFIFPMTDSSQARLIVENMIGLGKAYALNVTAEGVETPLQLEQLTYLKCDNLQGYYIGRPMSISQVSEQFIKRADVMLAAGSLPERPGL
ncbi:putative bifunctional diguanylate cyclase/phosphodiesterase [Mixta calida]|uniref:putative bifunctional diguanylate cyclase/phosphodiesterase n=1 Tax=Mixta calida TaxID=665913 RepID=UPI00289FEBFF|nr:EAL domain-containing protein [Mixta calida]